MIKAHDILKNGISEEPAPSEFNSFTKIPIVPHKIPERKTFNIY